MINYLNYEMIIDDAMRGVVKRVLQIVELNGLLHDHHFFISFLTESDGVVLSERLRKKYPHEMTIVLQYQFEGLYVEDKTFGVYLSFDGIRENIIIPFDALTSFVDPSTKFGVQFNTDVHPRMKADPELVSETTKEEIVDKDRKKVDYHQDGNVITINSFARKDETA